MDWGLRVHQILAIFDASFAYNKYGNGIKNLWLAKKKERVKLPHHVIYA